MENPFITALTMASVASLTLFAFVSILIASGGNARSREYRDLFRFVSGGFVVMFLILFLLASIGSLLS